MIQGDSYSLLRRFAALGILFLMAACSSSPKPFNTPYASGKYVDSPIQCVPYAREVSGAQLSGDAWTWWDQARVRYIRGDKPRRGAVLVLKRTPRMRSGHVAVVTEVVNARSIFVTHSNWGSNSRNRRIVYDAMRVDDVSRRNDWTMVRFWNVEKNVLGNPYAAYGFIYP